MDILKIARVADEQNLSLTAARDVVDRQERADTQNSRRACWNCGDPTGFRCCEFGRDS